MEWMFLPLRRYAQFSGRARRKEFWMWVLFVFLASTALNILDTAFGFELGGNAPLASPTGNPGEDFANGFSSAARMGILSGIFSLATFIPYLAVSVRRLHDTNRTGWWVAAPLLPYVAGIAFFVMGAMSASTTNMLIGGGFFLAGLVCAIVVLVWYCTKGTEGPNKYGPDPLDEGEDIAEVFS